MGKYLKKLTPKSSNAKAPWELTVLEVTTTTTTTSSSTQSCLGVRTRAKTIALQRLQKTTAGDGGGATVVGSGGVSYLQLRNRRLEKPPVHDSKRRNRSLANPNPRSSPNFKDSGGDGDGGKLVEDDGDAEKIPVDVKEEVEMKQKEVINNGDSVIEASFGENVLDFECRGRNTRESTPCSLIKDSDTIRSTPGSTTRPASSHEINQRIESSSRRNIPTANEMNEFFAIAEQQEQTQFIEKYNFDPVSEKPLPGRYEWVKLDP